jgi:hypothetical protein
MDASKEEDVSFEVYVSIQSIATGRDLLADYTLVSVRFPPHPYNARRGRPTDVAQRLHSKLLRL